MRVSYAREKERMDVRKEEMHAQRERERERDRAR